jgi:tetratricopeptide (TPR) repeat protein
MKSIIVVLAGLVLTWGCAQAPVMPEKDVYSDLSPQPSRTEYYKDLGYALFNEGNYDRAVEYFKLSLQHDPANSDARYWLSFSLHNKGQDNLALIELEKTDVINSFEYSRLQLVSDIYESVESYDKVIAINQKMYELRQESFPLWKNYQINLSLNRLDEAMNVLTVLEKKGEQGYNLHLARYEVFFRKGQLAEALSELQIAEIVQPLDFAVMKKMTEIQYDLQKWPELYATGIKFSKYYSFDSKVSEWLTTACINLAAYDDALAELAKQKAFAPASVELDFTIAHVLFLKRTFVDAEELYKDHYDISKSDQIVLKNLAREISSLETLASWSAYYPEAQIQLATLEMKSHQLDLALSRLQQAVELRPDSMALKNFKSHIEAAIKNRSDRLPAGQ